MYLFCVRRCRRPGVAADVNFLYLTLFRYEVPPFHRNQCFSKKRHILFIGTSHGIGAAWAMNSESPPHIKIHFPYDNDWPGGWYWQGTDPFWRDTINNIPSKNYSAVVVSFGQDVACFNSPKNQNWPTPWNFTYYEYRITKYIQ